MPRITTETPRVLQSVLACEPQWFDKGFSSGLPSTQRTPGQPFPTVNHGGSIDHHNFGSHCPAPTRDKLDRPFPRVNHSGSPRYHAPFANGMARSHPATGGSEPRWFGNASRSRFAMVTAQVQPVTRGSEPRWFGQASWSGSFLRRLEFSQQAPGANRSGSARHHPPTRHQDGPSPTGHTGSEPRWFAWVSCLD